MADAGTINSVPIASLYESRPVFFLGPILLACNLDCILLGCLFIQTWLYFGTFKQDALKFKVLVGTIVALNCGQSATTLSFTFSTFVQHFGDWNYLPLEPWIVVIILESFAAALSQMFFFSRAWSLATRKGRIVLSACFLTIPGSFALGIGTATEMALAPGGQVVDFRLLKLFSSLSFSWKAVGISTDLLLTATIIYYLRKSSHGIRFASTDRLVSKLSRYTFESQLLPLLGASWLLITYAQDVNSNLCLFGSFGETKLCACSILHCLNSRKKLRDDLSQNPASFVSPIGGTGITSAALREKAAQHEQHHHATSTAGVPFSSNLLSYHSHQPTLSFPDPTLTRPSPVTSTTTSTSSSGDSPREEKGDIEMQLPAVSISRVPSRSSSKGGFDSPPG